MAGVEMPYTRDSRDSVKDRDEQVKRYLADMQKAIADAHIPGSPENVVEALGLTHEADNG